jgi:two-component system, NtrC family, nitrogen regulation response regulator GlnG
MNGLENPAALDHAKAWERMRVLLDRLVTALDRDTFVDDVIDELVELLGADRGLVVLGDPEAGGTQVVNARGRGRALTAAQREEVSKTVMAEARRTGRCVVWEPHRHTSAIESMSDLGIVSAMAAPLRRASWWGGSTGGVLYVDFRDPRKEPGELHREFLESAAVLVSAVLEQRERLAAAREDLRAVRATRESHEGPGLEELLRAPSMAELRTEIRAALHGDSSILVLGESGTGKTALAHAIAEASGKAPIVRATLGSSDDLNTITSELFGHERGAFSGAATKRTGLVELANGGTLILDELLNLPPHAQQLLLDFTQFGTYRPLGWSQPQPKRARVRIVAATNGDLEQAIATGRFRQDLYFRLAGTVLVMPPLRARREDVPALAEAHLARIDRGRRWKLSVPSRRWLLSDHAPLRGNVRELEAIMRRARERANAEDPTADVIRPEHLDPRAGGMALPDTTPIAREPTRADLDVDPGELGEGWQRLVRERTDLDGYERRLIEHALARHEGVIAYAARELGVGRTSLISRMETLRIRRR